MIQALGHTNTPQLWALSQSTIGMKPTHVKYQLSTKIDKLLLNY